MPATILVFVDKNNKIQYEECETAEDVENSIQELQIHDIENYRPIYIQK